MKLHIGTDGFGLPVSVTEDVIAILGRRGRGKTTTAVVLTEELHAAGARFCVADPTGAWWGLKSSRDGKSPGIPCVVMGGDEHADVPLAPESGEIIADFVADPTSPSCVLDLKPFTQGEMVRFMTAFLARLYHRNSHPLHLILDEADQFAPQRPMPGEQAMLGAAQRVTKMGRVKGLHPILITQRPATLSKNVLTQAGLLISHAITGPQDRKAVDEWIKANAEEGEREKFLAELAQLPRGTAYFWSPDIPVFRQVAVRDRKTFDSSATPGQAARVQPKALAEVDLAALKDRIAATIERARAEDPRELRKTIAELRAELKKAEFRKPTSPVVEKANRVEIPVLKDAQVKRLEACVARADRAMEQLGKWALLFTGTEREVRNAAAEIKAAIAAATHTPTSAPGPVGTGGYRAAAKSAPGASPAGVVPGGGRGSLATPPPGRTGNGDGRLTGPEQRILDALAWLDSIAPGEHEQAAVAFLAGYTVGGGAFNNPRGALRGKGLIDYRGDRLALTDAGRAHANAPAGALTPEELQARVLERLPGPEGRLLRVLLEHYPRGVANDDLACAAGYEPGGGAYNNPRGRLRSLGLIEYRGGEVVARPVLFLEGARG